MRRVVDRVESLIQARPELPFTVETLAASVGVSRRTLHRCYERVRGVGPMEAIRRRRLVRVRRDLLSGAPATRVTDVAMRWGFTHLGRFAAAYFAHFGERPSDTLRRAREGGCAGSTAHLQEHGWNRRRQPPLVRSVAKTGPGDVQQLSTERRP